MCMCVCVYMCVCTGACSLNIAKTCESSACFVCVHGFLLLINTFVSLDRGHLNFSAVYLHICRDQLAETIQQETGVACRVIEK